MCVCVRGGSSGGGRNMGRETSLKIKSERERESTLSKPYLYEEWRGERERNRQQLKGNETEIRKHKDERGNKRERRGGESAELIGYTRIQWSEQRVVVYTV